MSNGNQKTLAARIAHLLENSERDGDASLAAALSRINDRLDRIEVMAGDRRGYWEIRGYSNTAHPWRDDRMW